MKNLILAVLRSARLAKTHVLGRRTLTLLAANGRLPIPILFYHRVADAPRNSCTIPFSVFARQMEFLKRRREVLCLEEVQRRLRQGDSYGKSVAITFDDGYAENSHQALPLLVRLGLPCTYFVSVDNIRFGKAFPHDVQWGRPFPPHSVEDLRRWADAGIEIGLHTRSHFDFTRDDCAAVIEREIHTAAEELRDLVSQPVRYFAFPYGMPEHLRPRVIASLRTAGFSGFCSAYGAYNHVGQNPFHLRRVHGDPEMTRFLNWIALDYRKIGRDFFSDAAFEETAAFQNGDQVVMDSPCSICTRNDASDSSTHLPDLPGPSAPLAHL